MATKEKESALAKPVAPPAKTPKMTVVSNLTLGSADDALTLAKELQKFVSKNGLTSKIQGKDFPNVEAWQFAGSLLGLSPLLEAIEDKSTANEIKWHATVSLQNVRTGAIVGRGFATCSNKESTKKLFADYAICSMAQTRAVGKAYRLSLGWLMKAAGYEATPAEEMNDVGTDAMVVVESEAKPAAANGASGTASTSPATRAKSGLSNDEIKAELDACQTLAEVGQLWRDVSLAAQEVLKSFFSAARQRIESSKPATSAPGTPAPAVVITPLPPGTLPAQDAEGQPIVYATSGQKEEIIRLLNHPLIIRSEKTKTMLNINRFTEEGANATITKLQGWIEERENGPLAGRGSITEKLRTELRVFVADYDIQLGRPEADRLLALVEDASVDANELRAELMAARDYVAELPAGRLDEAA